MLELETELSAALISHPLNDLPPVSAHQPKSWQSPPPTRVRGRPAAEHSDEKASTGKKRQKPGAVDGTALNKLKKQRSMFREFEVMSANIVCFDTAHSTIRSPTPAAYSTYRP